MSSASRCVYRSIYRISNQASKKQQRRIHFANPTKCRTPIPIRQFTTGPRWYAESKSKEDAQSNSIPEISESDYQTPLEPYTVADLDPAERATYETLSKQEQKKYLRLQNHAKAVLESAESVEALTEDAQKLARQIDREGDIDFREVRNVRAINQGFWADDEDDEFGQVEDDDDEASDEHITSVAESELELQREIREYYRITAWELPLLEKFTHPYTPPSKEQVLQFRYTTYMGEHHAAAKKVVCEFKVADLSSVAGLNAAQTRKLILLAGVRYHPKHDVVRMSSEKFENAAQNKRYLGELVQKLISEAKNASDMFEDVPIDVRHVKEKPRIRFPKSWFVNEEAQVQKLREARQQGLSAPASSAIPAPEEGSEVLEADADPERIVNGKILVGQYVRQKSTVNAMLR